MHNRKDVDVDADVNVLNDADETLPERIELVKTLSAPFASIRL